MKEYDNCQGSNVTNGILIFYLHWYLSMTRFVEETLSMIKLCGSYAVDVYATIVSTKDHFRASFQPISDGDCVHPCSRERGVLSSY